MPSDLWKRSTEKEREREIKWESPASSCRLDRKAASDMRHHHAASLSTLRYSGPCLGSEAKPFVYLQSFAFVWICSLVTVLSQSCSCSRMASVIVMQCSCVQAVWKHRATLGLFSRLIRVKYVKAYSLSMFTRWETLFTFFYAYISIKRQLQPKPIPMVSSYPLLPSSALYYP